jgi:hypothetical protein
MRGFLVLGRRACAELDTNLTPSSRGLCVAEALRLTQDRGENRRREPLGMYVERLILQALVLAAATEFHPVSRRRAYGTGSPSSEQPPVAPRPGTRSSWLGGRQVRRAPGPKRSPGSIEGLTRSQADASCAS